MRRAVACILTGLIGWPLSLFACTPPHFELQCHRVAPEQCARWYWDGAPVVVLGRVKETFLDPHPIQRFPAYGGKTRYAYAEIEIIEALKGKPVTAYVARIAEGECGAKGPFKVGDTGLFGLEDKPLDGPAVFQGQKQTQGQGRQLMPTITYSLARRWPDSLNSAGMIEFLRKQAKE